MNIFKKSFLRKKLKIGQILLTLEDTENRRRALNAKDTIANLFEMGIVPIVNENDTTATTEIRYGDNDRLAARVAQITNADTLIMLSDIDGLYSKNPNQFQDSVFIEKVTEINKAIEKLATKSISDYGSGGMITKIEAAKICMDSGCPYAN
jgi:Glutamate 5-kinase